MALDIEGTENGGSCREPAGMAPTVPSHSSTTLWEAQEPWGYE